MVFNIPSRVQVLVNFGDDGFVVSETCHHETKMDEIEVYLAMGEFSRASM